VRKPQVSFGLSFHPVIDFLFDPAPENTQKETQEVDEKTKDFLNKLQSLLAYLSGLSS
jgi:hypothetical protein